MNYIKTDTGYLLRFNKDEKCIEQLTAFVKEHKIKAAWLSGLGAAQGVKLGYYHLDKKEYEWKTITELVEITNLSGNITWQNDDLVLHIHGTFSNDHFQAIGGHVKELVVGATCEVHVILLGKDKIQRHYDEETGLNLLDL